MGGCDMKYTACEGINPFLHALKNIEESVKSPTGLSHAYNIVNTNI